MKTQLTEVNMKCLNCDKDSINKSKYCSSNCRGYFWRKKHDIQNEAKRVEGRQIKCNGCKKLFNPWHITSKFCSYNCSSKAREKWIELKCEQCNVKMLRKPYKPRRFCSKKCSEIAMEGHIPANRLRERQDWIDNPTSIEKTVYQELKLRGLLFEKQKLINGRFLVDAYIPSLNLVIECDGNYWHSLPKTVKRDKTKNAYLKKCGYNLIRLSETEINNGDFKRLESFN